MAKAGLSCLALASWARQAPTPGMGKKWAISLSCPVSGCAESPLQARLFPPAGPRHSHPKPGETHPALLLLPLRQRSILYVHQRPCFILPWRRPASSFIHVLRNSSSLTAAGRSSQRSVCLRQPSQTLPTRQPLCTTQSGNAFAPSSQGAGNRRLYLYLQFHLKPLKTKTLWGRLSALPPAAYDNRVIAVIKAAMATEHRLMPTPPQ